MGMIVRGAHQLSNDPISQSAAMNFNDSALGYNNNARLSG